MPNQPTVRFDFPQTYRTPSAPRRQGPSFIGSMDTSGAHAFANSLSSLNPAIQGFLRSGFDFYREQEQIRADEFSRNNKGSYAEAVRSGDLPAGASVFFREQVLRNEVKGKAQSYQMWLAAQWENDPDIKGADEDRYQAWVDAKTSDYLGTELTGYSEVLLREEFDGPARQVQNNLASHHLADGFRRMKQRGMEAITDGVLNAVRQTSIEDPIVLAQEFAANGGDIEGIQREYQLREQVTVQRIQDLIDEGHEVGLTYQELNKSVVDSVSLLAEQTGDTAVFGVLDRIQTGTGTLGKTRYAQEVRFDAEMRISARQMTDLRNQWAIEDRVKDEAQEAAYTSLIRDTMANPEQATQAIEGFISQYPELASQASAWANSIGKPISRNPAQEEAFLTYKHRAQVADLTPQEILTAGLNEEITTTQATHLLDELQSSQSSLTSGTRSRISSWGTDVLNRTRDSVFGTNTLQQQQVALELQGVYAQTITQRQQDGKPLTAIEELDLKADLTRRYFEMTGAPQEAPGAPPAAAQATTGSPTGQTQESAQGAPEEPAQATPETRGVTLPGGGAVQVPEAHIQYLMQNAADPTVLSEFDRKYGIGAAASVLMPDL